MDHTLGLLSPQCVGSSDAILYVPTGIGKSALLDQLPAGLLDRAALAPPDAFSARLSQEWSEIRNLNRCG